MRKFYHSTAASLLVVLIACGLFGLLIRGCQQDLRQSFIAQKLLYPLPVQKGSDALSSQLAIFTLGGLRSLSAEILALDALVAWSKKDWQRVEQRYEQMTILAPRRINYWISAAAEMNSNAAGDPAWQRNLSKLEISSKKSYFIKRGEQFLLDGITHNPDSALLYTRLGDHYSDLNRHPNFTKSVQAYKAAVQHGASALQERLIFYNLCRIRGREEEAWKLGKKLFESDRNHQVPSMSCLLFVLENKLQLPDAQRIPQEQLFGSPLRMQRILKGYLNNSLRFPIDGIKAYLDSHPIEQLPKELPSKGNKLQKQPSETIEASA